MIKLKIVKVGNNNEYVLEDEEKKQHSLSIGFYKMRKPIVGETIYLREEWLDSKSLSFAQLEYGDSEKDVKESDLAGIRLGDERLVLKRVDEKAFQNSNDIFASRQDMYAIGEDGKIYKMNTDVERIGYCENNIVVFDDGKVIQYDPVRYILAENYLIDKQEKVVTCLSDHIGNDAFIKSLGEIKDIAIKTDKDGNRVVVFTPTKGKDVELTLGGSNQIIGYSNQNVTTIENGFLRYTRSLTSLSLPNVTTIGAWFLDGHAPLTHLTLPKVKSVGHCFCGLNQTLVTLSMPNAEKIDFRWFFEFCDSLKKVYAPKLKTTVPEKFKTVFTKEPIEEFNGKEK